MISKFLFFIISLYRFSVISLVLIICFNFSLYLFSVSSFQSSIPCSLHSSNHLLYSLSWCIISNLYRFRSTFGTFGNFLDSSLFEELFLNTSFFIRVLSDSSFCSWLFIIEFLEIKLFLFGTHY